MPPRLPFSRIFMLSKKQADAMDIEERAATFYRITMMRRPPLNLGCFLSLGETPK